MTTPLALSRLPRTTLRLLVACYAHDRCPTLEHSRTVEPYASLWTRLHADHDWTPTATDCPLPLREVEAWLDGTQGKLRQWLEARLGEEEA